MFCLTLEIHNLCQNQCNIIISSFPVSGVEVISLFVFHVAGNRCKFISAHNLLMNWHSEKNDKSCVVGRERKIIFRKFNLTNEVKFSD